MNAIEEFLSEIRRDLGLKGFSQTAVAAGIAAALAQLLAGAGFSVATSMAHVAAMAVDHGTIPQTGQAPTQSGQSHGSGTAGSSPH